MLSSRRLAPLALLPVAVLMLGVSLQPAAAQYFGRNKVQYQNFDWQVLETEHFDIYYYESEREAAVQAGRMAERWYARLSRILDHEIRGRQPLVLYSDHPSFEQTNAVFGQIGESTGGVTEPLKRRIVLPLGASLAESDHVLGHEIVHAFQFDITGRGPNAVGLDIPVALRMPLWFIEGMAEYLSIGSKDPFKSQWTRGAVEAGELPGWGDLSKPRYFPYHYGHALWAYVAGRFGDDVVGRLLKAAARAPDMRQAFARVLGVAPDTLISDWHAAMRDVHQPVLEAASPPDSFARPLVTEEGSGTQQNLGPSLSPDGRWMVFASEKNLFSIELFVMDVETGEVVRKLTETARDPHFESLQWLNSSGAWSPDGERFALAAVSKGSPVISVFDPRRGEKLQEVKVRSVGEIFNPTWSPDGRSLAFSGQVDGFTDLFVLDLETEEVRRLTDDPFADLHPAWSPDGGSIAVVTDRFGADVEQLRYGSYRLGLVDPSTGEVTPLPALEEGKHINPQWGPEGRDLFFLSDRDGVANLYRMEVEAGAIYQVTNLQTGVSGITALSPALSVARSSGRVAFSVHGQGNFVFDIYTVEAGEKLAGRPVSEADALAGLTPAQLPPAERRFGQVDRLLADADLGLPDALTFETRDYSSDLSLDFIGRPSLAVGADQFGFFVGGGGSAFFSDMLGNKQLSTLMQVDGGQGKIFQSTAVFATYANLDQRVNWGVRGGQIPVIERARLVFRRPDGAVEIRDQRFWQINREVTALFEYPFNRAFRAEFSVGGRNIDFTAEERVLLVAGGEIVDEVERPITSLDTISSINTGRGSAALVYDNAIFGATAPMLGQRYRLEVSPTAGDLNYYTALADLRRYFMPARPLTLAFRALHVGRYGGGADDRRLGDFFLGNPGLVRGYDFGFGDFSDCNLFTGSCPSTQQFLGSRLATLNAEIRLPFVGGIGIIPASGVPPVDLIGFYDMGWAWDRQVEPDFLGGDRDGVSSAGVGARMNLFGLLVFEVDFVHAFDRFNPDTGEEGDWVWDFHFTPGF